MRLIPFFIAAIFLPFLCLDIIPRHNSNSHKFNQLLPQLQKFSATSPIYSTNHPSLPKLRRPSPSHRSSASAYGAKAFQPSNYPRWSCDTALWTEGLPALTSCEAPYRRGGIALLNLRTEKKCPRGTSSRTLSICDYNLLQTYFVIFLYHCKQCPGKENQYHQENSDNSPMY